MSGMIGNINRNDRKYIGGEPREKKTVAAPEAGREKTDFTVANETRRETVRTGVSEREANDILEFVTKNAADIAANFDGIFKIDRSNVYSLLKEN